MEGGGGDSSPINSLLKQIRTVNLELEKYQDGGSSIGKALTNSTFPLAEALAMEQVALEDSIRLLEKRFKTELAGNIINTETIQQLEQQKNKLGEIKGVLTDFIKLQEAASGDPRITINSSANEKELAIINPLLKKIREKAKLEAFMPKLIAEINRQKQEKNITEKEELALLEKLNPKKKVELTLEQKLVESYKKARTELDALNIAQGKVGELSQGNAEKQAFLNQKIKEAMEANDLYKKSALTTAQVIDEGFKTAVGSLPKELSTAIVQGENLFKTLENSFNRMLENILQQILESQIQSALTQLFAPSGTSGSSTNFLAQAASFIFGAPGKAVGGPVAGGKPYMVGEQGPEMFMPNTAGQIVSNSELNSGGGGAVVNFNINAIDTQTGVEFLLENKKNIIGMVSQGYNQRGRQGITS
jgi:phage-related minor tail protein